MKRVFYYKYTLSYRIWINNDPDNLMVFRTNGDHKSYHSQIDFGLIPIILINDDGSYGTITRIQPENYIS